MVTQKYNVLVSSGLIWYEYGKT